MGKIYIPRQSYLIGMALKNGGLGAFPRKIFETTPCRTSENARFAELNIVVFIDLHTQKEKLIPQPSYAELSFLLLHANTPMLVAKESHASRSETKPSQDI